MKRSGSRLLICLTAAAALLLGGLSSATAQTGPPTRVDLPAATTAASATAAKPAPVAPMDLGPNVLVLDPSMSTAAIKAAVDAIAAKQVHNEMGPERYAILFRPGTYGSAADPLTFEVGYGTEVAGLGVLPTDVVINGHVDVYNQCFPLDDPNASNCFALNNFWRSLSNLTITVTGLDGCHASGAFWAVSQAAPMRRVKVTGGNLTLMDYCSSPAFASGGFIADSDLGSVINGSQQQFFVRNSSVTGWSNGVWNQVFSGVEGAPATCFPAQATCGPYTTVPTTSVSREKPFLTMASTGDYQVVVPTARTNTSGTSWANGPTAARTIPLSDFYVAHPGDSAKALNTALARGQNLLLTPGAYQLDRSLDVKRANTVILGLGLPTLTPTNGNAAITVADVPGVDLAGLMVDAGPVNSDVLVRIGTNHARGGAARDRNGWSSAANPTGLQDVFFRIGGPHVGRATVSLEVNSDHVILDDIWAWRADHGVAGSVGWDVNTGDTGLVVNGDDVTATGLFVEHYQKYEVIWNGERGNVVFFQNELPYDPPSQAAWSHDGIKGWAALKVAAGVQQFRGTGMGSYSFFNQGIDIYADHAFEVPTSLAPGSLTNLLTIFLDPSKGKGGILHVVNDAGGSSTIANPDVPVTVTSYP